MDKKINIGLSGEGEVGELWTVATFNQAYDDPKYSKGCSLAYAGKPAQKGSITLRCAIEKGVRLNAGQKFILGIRFHDWGNMTTLDLISLDEGFHTNIAFEHLNKLDWRMFDHGGIKPREFEETMYLPLIFIGGHVSIDNEGALSFTDIKDTYSSDALSSAASSIAAYVANACGLDIGNTDVEKGEKFIVALLSFLHLYKGDKEFYGHVLAHIYGPDTFKTEITNQQINALITMKAYDRSKLEGIDLVAATAEEVSTGPLAKYIFAHGTVEKVKFNIS